MIKQTKKDKKGLPLHQFVASGGKPGTYKKQINLKGVKK